jgi:Family of unknown function (DUF5360)
MKYFPPSSALLRFMFVVDVGFVLYWLTTGLGLLPAAWLYAHHEDLVMVAWNNSFLPLDLAISASGITAIVLARKNDASWVLFSILSLALTSASGLNAVAFWTLRRDFDPAWWTPNLVLLFGPLFFLRQIAKSIASASTH